MGGECGKKTTMHQMHRHMTQHMSSDTHWGESDGRDGVTGMAMVQDTQGKRLKRPQVSRIPTRPARVLRQGALLTSVCWRESCVSRRTRKTMRNATQ